MTDRELLTLAARAAGIEWQSYHMSRGLCLADPKHGMVITQMWNPLVSDADALRLAVKLGLAISIDLVEEMSYAHHEEAWRGSTEKWCCYPTSADGGSQDAYAATRRAIVRAAAAIGESMK